MHTIDNQGFGLFLAQLRKEKGMTQKQLAEQLFVSDKAVSKWERGLSFPDIALIMPLSELLSVSTTELLSCRRLEEDTQFSIDEVEQLMSKTIVLSKEEQVRKAQDKARRIKLFKYALFIFTLELICLMMSGYTLETIPESVYTLVGLMILFGVYFTFIVKETLPVYYDENKISQYTDGAFRMNMMGVHFNNSNWKHVVRVTQLTLMCIWVCVPIVYWVVSTLAPLFWDKVELLVTLSMMMVLFIPIYYTAKKYE